MRHVPADSSPITHLPLCSEAKNANVYIQRECDMSRLSKLAIVQFVQRIALGVMGLMPAPVLIPIPVVAKRDSQMTRRIR